MPAIASHEIYRLIYLSSARSEITPDILDTILDAARRNNEPVGVTGLLLFHDGCFFQVLEGPQAEVERLFRIIEADRRHSGVIVVETKVSHDRAFGGWSMGYIGAHALRRDQRDRLIDLAGLIGGDGTQAFSASTSSASTSVQIASFLASFREFAPA